MKYWEYYLATAMTQVLAGDAAELDEDYYVTQSARVQYAAQRLIKRQRRIRVIGVRRTCLKDWMQSEYRDRQAIMPETFKVAVKRKVKELIRQPVTAAALNLLKEMVVSFRVLTAKGPFRKLRGKQNLKVHLGCGADIRVGWVNIDLVISRLLNRMMGMKIGVPRDTVFINHDLRRGLPLNRESCELIYSSHFLEHLEYRYGVKLMRDCYRALRPGGVFRAALPNFSGTFDAYLRRDYKYVDLIDILKALPDVEPGTETFADHINYGVYQYGEHKCVYDEEKFTMLLQKISFSSVSTTSYREGMDPDTPERRRYSFYMEAVK